MNILMKYAQIDCMVPCHKNAVKFKGFLKLEVLLTIDGILNCRHLGFINGAFNILSHLRIISSDVFV